MKLPGLVPPASVSNRRPAGPAKVRMAVVRMPGQTPKAALGRSSTVEHRARRGQTPEISGWPDSGTGVGGAAQRPPVPGLLALDPGASAELGCGLAALHVFLVKSGSPVAPHGSGSWLRGRKEENTSLRLPVSPGAEPGHREDGRRLYRSHHVMCRVW